MGVRWRATVLLSSLSIAVLAACSPGGTDTAADTGPGTSASSAVTPDSAVADVPDSDATVVAGPGTATPTLPAASSATGPSLPAGGTELASSTGGSSATAPGAPAPAGGDAAGLTGKALEEYVARRYEAYWDAFDAARSHPTADPAGDFPELAELAAGSQLDVSRQTVADMAAAGEATKEPDRPAIAGTDAATEHRVRVDRIDGATAELTACVVNDDVRYVAASGQVVDAGVRTVRSTATMALTEGGVWKLIRSQAVSIDDGVTGCWSGDDYPY